MDTFLGATATTWTGIYTLLTALLLVAAVASALYARHQWKATRAQAELQHQAQMEALRPYVTVTVEASPASINLIDLVVRNVGSRAALNVAIKLDPPPERAIEQGPEDTHIRNMKLLTTPMHLLAPGQTIRVLYDNILKRKDRDDLPDEHSVTVTYIDTSGSRYTESFILDLLALQGALQVDVGTIHTLSKSLTKIQKRLDSSKLLTHGELSVDATFEPRERAIERRETEEKEDLRSQIELVSAVMPNDPLVGRLRQKLHDRSTASHRTSEGEATAAPLSRFARGRLAARWVRRLFKDRLR